MTKQELLEKAMDLMEIGHGLLKLMSDKPNLFPIYEILEQSMNETAITMSLVRGPEGRRILHPEEPEFEPQIEAVIKLSQEISYLAGLSRMAIAMLNVFAGPRFAVDLDTLEGLPGNKKPPAHTGG